MNSRYLHLFGCFIIFLPHADAGIFAREDFNYSDGNLAGSSGGLGWSEAWNNVAGTPTVLGSKGKVNAVANQQGSRLISQLQQPPAGGTKVAWISFEAQQFTNVSGTATTNSYGGLGLFRGNTEQLLIGKSWPGDYQWKAGTGQALIGPTIPVPTLSMTRIVARITMVDAATDTLDVWLNPADTSSVAALGTPQITRTDADLSFDTLRIRSGEGDAAVTAENWAFDAVSAGDDLADVVASDSDGDGMLDAWETANGLVVGLNDANEGVTNRDNDGLSNLQEFLRSTNPNDPDTDADGLQDGVETGTGIYVNANNTGTNPLLPDSDEDGLYDPEENNSGIFVSELDPGTNPNLGDTDGDGHGDLFEISHGSSPLDAESKPPTGDLAIVGSDDFNAYADGPVAGLSEGNGFDYDNSTVNNLFTGHTNGDGSDWDNQFGISNVVGGKLQTLNSAAKREFNGPGGGAAVGTDEYWGAVNQEAGTIGRIVYLRADMKRGEGTTWGGISAFDFAAERVFAGVVANPNPASGNLEFAIGTPAPAPVYTGIQPVPGRDYTLVLKLDYENDLVSLWVDPDLNAPESAPVATAPFTLDKWTTAGRLGSGGAGTTEWDNFVVARQWSALSVFPGVTPANNYLAWIAGFAVGEETAFGQDPDHDGLRNGLENALGTSPAAVSQGLHGVASPGGGVFKFRHTRTNSPATDVTPSYEWSSDLVNWHASGATSTDGVTATISDSVITETTAPAADEIEVTVTVVAGSPPRGIFARLKADLQ